MSFVPFDKMSNKQKAEINKKKRKTWSVNPVTRKVQDKTKYSRKEKHRRNNYDD